MPSPWRVWNPRTCIVPEPTASTAATVRPDRSVGGSPEQRCRAVDADHRWAATPAAMSAHEPPDLRRHHRYLVVARRCPAPTCGWRVGQHVLIEPRRPGGSLHRVRGTVVQRCRGRLLVVRPTMPSPRVQRRSVPNLRSDEPLDHRQSSAAAIQRRGRLTVGTRRSPGTPPGTPALPSTPPARPRPQGASSPSSHHTQVHCVVADRPKRRFRRPPSTGRPHATSSINVALISSSCPASP